jgi:hypothetical protein
MLTTSLLDFSRLLLRSLPPSQGPLHSGIHAGIPPNLILQQPGLHLRLESTLDLLIMHKRHRLHPQQTIRIPVQRHGQVAQPGELLLLLLGRVGGRLLGLVQARGNLRDGDEDGDGDAAGDGDGVVGEVWRVVGEGEERVRDEADRGREGGAGDCVGFEDEHGDDAEVLPLFWIVSISGNVCLK